MKLSVVIFLFPFLCSSQTSTDRMSFYVLNSDTTYITNSDEIIHCNFMISNEKSHNKCSIQINDQLFTGRIQYQIANDDSSYLTFDGEVENGLILNGTIIKFNSLGNVKMTGQYCNNWKIGFWTTYHLNGNIESIGKHIKGSDYPVIEREYDENGILTYYNDEQIEIEKRIKQGH